MIKKIKHRGLKKFHEKGNRSQVMPDQADRIERMLDKLEVAEKPGDMNFPGYGLHPLKGNKKGLWSITVTGNWRIVCRFDGDDVTDVDLTDYH